MTKTVLSILSLTAATASAAALPVWVDSDAEIAEYLFTGTYESPTNTTLHLAGGTQYRVSVDGEFRAYGPARGPLGYDRLDDLAVPAGRHTVEVRVAGMKRNNYEFINQEPYLLAELPGQLETGVKGWTCHKTGRIGTVPKFTIQRSWREARVLPEEGTEVAVKPMPARLQLPRRIVAADTRLNTSGAYDEKTGIVTFDHNETGFFGATVTCTEPTTVTLTFDELLKDGKVDPKRIYQGGNVTWQLTKPGTYALESFEPYTGKYAHWQAAHASFSKFYIRRYACGETAKLQAKVQSFASKNDDELSRIYASAVETFAQNAADVMTDCPSRERAGWLCDSYFTARAAYHLLGDLSYETLFLENFAKATSFPKLPEGMVPMCYPSDIIMDTNNYIPNWAMFLLLQIENYQKTGGNPQLIADLKPRVEGVVRFMKQYANAEGLLENLPGWVFVEWSETSKYLKGVNYPSNMLWSEALSAAGRVYGRADWVKEGAALKETIRARSLKDGWYTDHNLSGAHTETCQYYAFYFGVATPARDPVLWNRLMTEFGPDRMAKGLYPDVAKSNAFIGNFLRLELLARDGRRDQLRHEIKGYFLKMADLTGTLWEMDSPTASCCHGFTSYLAVLLDL